MSDEGDSQPDSDEEVTDLAIGGEDLHVVSYPYRAAAPLAHGRPLAPPPVKEEEQAQAPTLAIPGLPPIPLPQLQWPPFLPPLPWMPQPQSGTVAAGTDLPPLPPPQAPGRIGRPKFRELQKPVAGWLEVARAPAASTTLDLSPGSGAKGSPTDATLLSVSKNACGSLRKLNLTACPAITLEAIINVCRGNPRVTSVRCSYGTPWSAGAVTQLLNAAPELKAVELDLACRKLKEDILGLLVEPVVRPRSLTCINKMEPATAIKMLAPVLKSTQLRRLDLTGTAVGPDGADAICLSLSPEVRPGVAATPHLPPLKYLSLRGCRLGRNGAVSVALMLRNNPIIRGVDVSLNRLGDEGCIEMAHALCRTRGGNATLKTLLMARNGMTEISAAAVAEVIETNTCLEVLSVADNDMGPAAGRLIATSLRRNFVLQELYAFSNNYGEAVGKLFLSALQGGKSNLWKLDVHNNLFTKETDSAIAVLTLKQLLLRATGFDWERAESFDEDPYDDGSSDGSSESGSESEDEA